MADAPYYAPRPAPPSIRSAVPLASPCRPSFRNCHEQKSPPDYPRLWCLNRSKAAIALFPLIIFPSGGKVGSYMVVATEDQAGSEAAMIPVAEPTHRQAVGSAGEQKDVAQPVALAMAVQI